MGQTVSHRELTKSQRIRGEAGADDPESGAEPDQQVPTHKVGAQDQIAEHGIVGNQLAYLLGRDDEYLAVLDRFGGEERHLTFQESELAQETPRTVHAQYPALAVRVAFVDDCDLSGKDDDEIVVRRAFSDQHLAGVNRSTRATDLELRDLVVRQPREGALLVRGLVVDRRAVPDG